MHKITVCLDAQTEYNDGGCLIYNTVYGTTACTSHLVSPPSSRLVHTVRRFGTTLSSSISTVSGARATSVKCPLARAISSFCSSCKHASRQSRQFTRDPTKRAVTYSLSIRLDSFRPVLRLDIALFQRRARLGPSKRRPQVP